MTGTLEAMLPSWLTALSFPLPGEPLAGIECKQVLLLDVPHPACQGPLVSFLHLLRARRANRYLLTLGG